MKIGAVIQARLSSERFPGKVLKPLPYNSAISVLEQVISRTMRAQRLHEIVVATTTDVPDLGICEVADRTGVRWYRGSRENVLERYYQASKESGLDIIVRITADCPCADPSIIDRLIELHMDSGADYTSNCKERTFPHGLDAEVISFNALRRAHQEAKEDFELEHVTPYIYRTNPGGFRIRDLKADEELNAPDIRITLDTREDYTLLCAVFDFLYTENNVFSARDIVALFRKKPWLGMINEKVMQKKASLSVQEEIAEALRVLELQELLRAREILGSAFLKGTGDHAQKKTERYGKRA
ncbi:MAG: glycosyltransferase family protein [Nitrospirota bacterium]